jgi:hypothetical protein
MTWLLVVLVVLAVVAVLHAMLVDVERIRRAARRR